MNNFGRVLLIKNLPSALSKDEKAEFLKCFGCDEVRVMPSSGHMKHCAFMVYSDCGSAKTALQRLHQLKVLDSVLIAQFAQTLCGRSKTDDSLEEVEKESKSKDQNSSACSQGLCEIAQNIGVSYPSNPLLKYLYPEPNADVLLNICGALLSVPKFYTQVLHLMNKMNLFSPFCAAHIVPPVLLEHFQKSEFFSAVGKGQAGASNDDTTESELESDKEWKADVVNVPVINRKRKKKTVSNSPLKKLKSLKYERGDAPKSKILSDELGVVFENRSSKLHNPHITLSIPSVIQDPSQASADKVLTTSPSPCSFGKLNPIAEVKEAEEVKEFTSLLVTTFISERELQNGRLESHDLLRNYSPGQPSSRLYIKNLHKKVTEKDLHHIYGLFIDRDNDEHLKMFDVRLMTQGRMKGQAFIKLPDVNAASRAVQLTNGYQLFGKPIIVSFARSAKQQES